MPVFYFDTERAKHPYTGLYEYCAQLASALIRQLRGNEKLVCYGPPDVAGRWPASVQWLPQRRRHRLWLPQQDDASLWHCTYQRSRFLPRWDVPKVVTIHDLNFLYEQRSAHSMERNRRRVQANVDRADALIAISQFVAEDLAKNVDTKGKSVFVIHNGCDVDFDPAFDGPSYRPERPFLFTIGPTIPKKNFHVLPCLLRGNGYELVIAGSARSPYRDKILEEARRHHVAERVKIIGNISQEEKFWYYRHCEAFVFPSIAEGFGLPVIEAMHFSKPTFISRLTSLPEIGRDFAYYFDSFDPDAMSEVFDRGMSTPFTLAKKQAMAQHAASFSWDRAASQYLDVYRSLARS